MSADASSAGAKSARARMAGAARWLLSVVVPAPLQKRESVDGVFGGRIAELLLGLGSIA